MGRLRRTGEPTTSRALRVLGLATAALLALVGCTDADGTDGSSSSTSAAPKGDGTLVLGTALGAVVTSPERAGVQVAVTEINAAGGVNGKPVSKVDLDAADPAAAAAAITAQKVDVAVVSKTPGSAAQTLAGAGVPLLWTQPVSTGNGVFGFAATDAELGDAVATTAAKAGHKLLGVLAPDGAEGKAAVAAITAAATREKVNLATDAQYYDPAATTFTIPVTKLKGGQPDAIIVLGAATPTKGIIAELETQRLGAAAVPLYLAGANTVGYPDLPAGWLNGAKGVRGGAPISDTQRPQFSAVDPALSDFAYGPEAYDATIVAALAAQAAGDDDGSAVQAQLVAVTNQGTECKTYAACLALLEDKKDIAYVGASGPITLNKDGQRSSATVAMIQYGADNQPTVIGTATATLES